MLFKENFVTGIDAKNIELYGENRVCKENEMLNPVEAVVNWNLDIESKRWGIKSMNPVLADVSVNLVKTDLDGNELEWIKITAKDMDAEFDDGVEMWKSMYPVAVEVDFKSKKILVRMN